MGSIYVTQFGHHPARVEELSRDLAWVSSVADFWWCDDPVSPALACKITNLIYREIGSVETNFIPEEVTR